MEDKKDIKEEEKQDKKCNKHGIIYWVIVILGVTIIMVLSINIGQILITEVSSNKNNSSNKLEVKEDKKFDYSLFLKNKEYLKDTTNWENKPYSYYLYDIDKDGEDELFVVSFEGKETEFFNTVIYTYKNNEIKTVANLYTYKYVYGYSKGEGVVYATQKTSSINYYVLYKLVDDKLEVVDNVSFETGDSRIVVKEPIKLP